MTSSVSDFGRDHGLIHETVVTGRRAGWKPNTWARLAHDMDLMAQVRLVLERHATIEIHRPLINCDADPLVPEGLTLESHRQDGWITLNPYDITLYSPQDDRKAAEVTVVQLDKRLTHRRAYNANVLDYLLANPHFIPPSWQAHRVIFWGTKYRTSFGDTCVRYLTWGMGEWSSRGHAINPESIIRDPVAVLAA